MTNEERGAVYQQYIVEAMTAMEVFDPSMEPSLHDDGSVGFKLDSGSVCFANMNDEDEYFFKILAPFIHTPETDSEREKATFAALAVCDEVKVAKVGFGGDESLSASIEMFCDPVDVLPKIVFLRAIVALRHAIQVFFEKMEQ